MTTRPVFVATALLLLSSACDGGMTGPSYLHLTSLAPSASFSCGLDAQGHAYCWGRDNSLGQLGDGTNAPSQVPTRVKTGARFLQVVTGNTHACGLTTDDRVLCWGDNSQSQLGVTTTDLDCDLVLPNGWTQDFGNACAVTPAAVQTTLRFVEIDAGGDRTCGRTSGGAIWCWGSAWAGLGDEAITARSDSLVRVAGAGPYATLAIGQYHACATDSHGQGYCWGNNYSGELGGGAAESIYSVRSVPTAINSSAFIKRWALGAEHTCALTGGGEALCWGRGDVGQRGDSTTVPIRSDPTYVATPLRFGQIAAAANATCALEAGTGAAWCWGENSEGQLGDGTRFDRLAPAPVLGGLKFSRLVMAVPGWPDLPYACGSSSGAMYCWGLLPEPLTFEE